MQANKVQIIQVVANEGIFVVGLESMRQQPNIFGGLSVAWIGYKCSHLDGRFGRFFGHNSQR